MICCERCRKQLSLAAALYMARLGLLFTRPNRFGIRQLPRVLA